MREKPLEIKAFERLLVRMSTDHPRYNEFFERKYRLEAGYSGELDVDRVLHEIEFSPNSIILKNIRLQVSPHFEFEIDTLILTTTRLIILEIKKYTGKIYFDEEVGKTIKVSETGKVDRFDCAVHQLLRAESALQRWISERNINLPIESIIVMANQRTIIEKWPESVKIKYKKQLPRHISELPVLAPVLADDEIKQLAEWIEESAIQKRYLPACDKYKLPCSDLKWGVLCSNCNGLMNRKRGQKWRCTDCGKYADNEVRQALDDWFLLVKPAISNLECRKFLGLKSKFAASIILRESNLKRLGNPPKTYYC